MRRSSSRFGRHDEGATVVEFALVFPVVLLLILGVLDFGRGVAAYLTVSNASREGLRYASLHPASNAEDAIRDAVLRRTITLDTRLVTVRATYSNDDGRTWVAWDTIGSVTSNETQVRVEVGYPWTAATSVIGGFIGNGGTASFRTTSTGLAQLSR